MKPYDTTDALLNARAQLLRLNVGELFASGIDVTLHNYSLDEDGEARPDHMNRVTLHGEHFAPVRAALLVALDAAIQYRADSLRMQLRDIEKVLTVNGIVKV